MTAMLSERESPQGSFQALDEITYKETLQGGVFYFANRRSGKKTFYGWFLAGATPL